MSLLKWQTRRVAIFPLHSATVAVLLVIYPHHGVGPKENYHAGAPVAFIAMTLTCSTRSFLALYLAPILMLSSSTTSVDLCEYLVHKDEGCSRGRPPQVRSDITAKEIWTLQ